MSREHKYPGTASGKPETPMQQMKDVWKRMSEDARDYWREQLGLSESEPTLRKLSDVLSEIQSKLKVKFSSEKRLSEFRNWVIDQDKRDAQAERMQENERRLADAHPDWSVDRVREEVIRQSYFESLATGNFKLGLATVKQDLNAKKVSVDERKLKLLEKKAEAFDQAKGILGNKELSDDEKKNRMHELFGL